ncbi:uncharacterized protein LOC144180103 [Haemaphysalis longicornis]
MVAKNHFCLFTQLALVIGTRIPVCVNSSALVPKSDTCPLPEACSDIGADFLEPPHPLCDATSERLRKAATTSTATTVDYISSSSKHHPFSGHGMAAATMVAKNHFCLFTQVGGYSIHCRRCNNVCLLLFPCPNVFKVTAGKCVHVVKFLLLGGDVELNPGPPTPDPKVQDNEVLLAIGRLTEPLDERHDNLLASIEEVKNNQKVLDNKVSDLTTRLANLEEKVNAFENVSEESRLDCSVASAIRSENAALRARLDDYEDRSRRDNLIFHGISDTAAETWSDTEEKVRAILSSSFEMLLSDDAISRAHRLGAFVADKCRPVVVRFASFKVRDTIFSKKAKLRNTNININEDFCKATRTARKKLTDFGKASGQKYSVKHNKVVINKKSYVYCPVTDRVLSVDTVDDNNETTLT